MNLKDIRKTPLYLALMKVPGVELMQIEYELQAVVVAGVSPMFDEVDLSGAFRWEEAPQGFHFWIELWDAQADHRFALVYA